MAKSVWNKLKQERRKHDVILVDDNFLSEHILTSVVGLIYPQSILQVIWDFKTASYRWFILHNTYYFKLHLSRFLSVTMYVFPLQVPEVTWEYKEEISTGKFTTLIWTRLRELANVFVHLKSHTCTHGYMCGTRRLSSAKIWYSFILFLKSYWSAYGRSKLWKEREANFWGRK